MPRPKATEVTERQMQVVECYTRNMGDVRATAEELGVTTSGVYGTLSKDIVREHIASAARSELSGYLLPAVRNLGRLATSAKSEFVQLQAATAIMDRAGLSEPKQDQTLAIQINLDTST